MWSQSDYVVGEVIDFVYNGCSRRGEIVKVAKWGVTANVYGEGFKSFNYYRMKSVRIIKTTV